MSLKDSLIRDTMAVPVVAALLIMTLGAGGGALGVWTTTRTTTTTFRPQLIFTSFASKVEEGGWETFLPS